MLVVFSLGSMELRAVEPVASPSFGLLRDTVFVTDSIYLEIRLDEQITYVRRRSGEDIKILCSTGTPRIQDGIATRKGVFQIGVKARRPLSQQFQVHLNYWMQFDGGIGFHGLDNRSYYRHLGRRPSSHGCIRIRNEDGKRLYELIPSGTIVWVHSGTAARVVAFAPLAGTSELIPYLPGRDELSDRLEAVNRLESDHPSLSKTIVVSRHSDFRAIPIGQIDRDERLQLPLRLREPDPGNDLPLHTEDPPIPLTPLQPEELTLE